MTQRKTTASRSPIVQIAIPGGPRISVIIPARNEERLLEGCLQQFTPEIRARYRLEIIVSDGGSSDTTVGIATAYADFIATHEEPWRQTIAEGRNRGAALASGEILLFLNADSRLSDTRRFLDQVIRNFATDSLLAALATKVQIAPSERRWSDVLFHGYFNEYVRALNLLGIGMGRGECQVVRREAFERIRGYAPELAAGEDFELYHRLQRCGRVKYDHKLLVFESPRRYRKYGYLRVYWDWIRNGLAVLLRHRAASDVWEEVR